MNGFGEPGWYRSVETVHEEKGERVIEVPLMVLGSRAVESSGGKTKFLGFFVGVLRGSRRFIGVDSEKHR